MEKTGVEFAKLDPAIFQFLEELADNNSRTWFQANKARYEHEVLEPCLALVRAFAPRLRKISRFLVASDRRIGGSLMRVYRDTRFSPDKTPYKTNAGIQFRHELGRDVHAPGFYVHIAPGECFLAAGVWRPDRWSVLRIRDAIAAHGTRWLRARNDRRFRHYFELVGDSLKRPPPGFAADHPLIEDLKRTEWMGFCQLSEQDVLDAQFLNKLADVFASARPLMRFLCEAMELPF